MRRAAVTAAVVAMTGLAAVAITSTTSQAAEPAAAARKVLRFDVAFSPLSLIAANNERTRGSLFALGDEITFHDQLSVHGKRVGDEVGSCVLAELSPEPIAITGGTGVYRNAGGEGTLVEFANQTGVLTLRVLART